MLNSGLELFSTGDLVAAMSKFNVSLKHISPTHRRPTREKVRGLYLVGFYEVSDYNT